MSIGTALLPEFEQEMANTRKTLERVPNDRFDFKPHPRSPTMGWLAGFLANLPAWVAITIDRSELDIMPNEGEGLKLPVPKSIKEVLETFDKNVAAAKSKLTATPDDVFAQPWTLKARGKPQLTMSKLGIIRSYFLNHTVHHRAQLGVYLRLNDLPVPAMYGPTADEGGFK